MVIVQTKARIVKAMFSHVAKFGLGRSSLGKLDKMLSGHGGGSAEFVKRIVTNRAYYGVVRTKCHSLEVGIEPLFVDHDGFSYFRGSHEPLVSQSLWEKANARIVTTRSRRNNRPS
ncbi:hypothetical protein ASA1KI_21350 [Opitutales bacterium ASA1]|nr:hypothetical protein ASA1KI_21350 [Opitutales bacterium ASA1]